MVANKKIVLGAVESPAMGSMLETDPHSPGYPKTNILFFLVFLAFVVGRYIDIGHRMDILATIRFEFLLGGMASVLAGFQMLQRPPNIGQAKVIVLFITLLFFTMFVQIPFAAAPVAAQRIFTDRVFKFSILTFLIVVMVNSPNTLRLFIAAFLFSIFYITLESVRGLISGGLIWQNQGIMRLHGAVPMYAHPNSLGGVSLGSLPFVIFLFPCWKNWILRLGLLATAGTSITCALYSGSRTAYVGFLSLLFWAWFLSEKKIKALLVILVAGSIAVTFLPEEYIGRFQSIGVQNEHDGSRAARLVIWQDAFTIFQENPLGVGIASFRTVRYTRFGRTQDTHNLYLEVATNLGIQGLAVFLILVGLMLWFLRKSAISFQQQRNVLRRRFLQVRIPNFPMAKVREHDGDLQFLSAVAKGTAGFIVTRLIVGFWGMDLYEVYWWFGAGLTLVLSGLVVSSTRKTKFMMAIDIVDPDPKKS